MFKVPFNKIKMHDHITKIDDFYVHVIIYSDIDSNNIGYIVEYVTQDEILEDMKRSLRQILISSSYSNIPVGIKWDNVLRNMVEVKTRSD